MTAVPNTRFSFLRNRKALVGAAGVALVVGLVPVALPAVAAEEKPAATGNTQRAEEVGNYDSRRDPAIKPLLAARKAATSARPAPGVKRLRSELGAQGIVDIDPVTRTARVVTRLDRFLTAPSAKGAKDIVLDYVKARADVFGLSADEVSGLTLRKEYVDVAGTRHLSFVQADKGIPFFGNGLKAHVTKKGELIQVDGAPVAQPAGSTAGLTARLTATEARDAAVGDVFGASRTAVKTAGTGAVRKTEFANGDQAQLVLFQTIAGPRLAWQTITLSEGFIHVVDAENGRTLFRQSTVHRDSGKVFDNYPGAPSGGTQQIRSFRNWLPNNSPSLKGPYADVYLDLDDNDAPGPGERVGPSAPRQYHYPFKDFTAEVGPPCAPQYKCSWNPDVPFSWEANKNQNATQLFYFINTFHDHLKAAPIGFTAAAGNFEVDDPVVGQGMDGANTADGLPDGTHVNNANMNTPPDGISPRMQMFLFHTPGDPTDPFIAGNSGDDAGVVYHEYVHGLSNRLVVDANGVSTLGNVQAGAMGEAWSDWYAMDYLVSKGLEKDTAVDGELRIGEYVGAGQDLIRTQPVDCAVGSTSPDCAGTPTAGTGGYTYGDFGRIGAGPEVHDDGEIWASTLWDLRRAIGSKAAQSLVTRAMELSPANPSFLDMRNSILQADLVVNGGSKQKKIWQTFAARGMGWFAGSIDGDDTAPTEDFSLPPAANTPKGTLTGKVTDADTGAPVTGAIVAFGGHNSGFAGDYAATTAADGTYTISGIFPGTYPKVFARGPGYDLKSGTVSIAARTQTLNWTLRRDWAASAGGASIGAFTPPDYSEFGCGPAGLIDQSQGNGWGSTAPTSTDPDAGPFPKWAVINLPAAVNIAEVQINPSATCGDAGSASTGDYRVETSVDGTTWILANEGHFTVANRGRMNTVPLAAGSTTGIRFVRYTMISTQVADVGGVCPGPFSGCEFMDSTELAVYGAPAS